MDRARMSSCITTQLLNFSTAGALQSSCYKHDYSINEWTLFGNLNTARDGHASALLNGDLWMTGGRDERDVKLKFPRFFKKLILCSCLNIFNQSNCRETL